MRRVPDEILAQNQDEMQFFQQRHELNSDLNLFNKAFLGHKLRLRTPDVHYEINDALMDDAQEKTLIIAPRGIAKSTLSSVAYPLWRALRHDGEQPLFILIGSMTQSIAVTFLQAIKYEIEFNPKIRYYYGNLKSSDSWSKTRIELNNKVCIQAIGSGQQVRGFQFLSQRPNLIILDDFEGEQNSLTAEARQQNKEWVTGAVIPSLDSHNSRVICIGTIIHNDSFLNTMKDNSAWSSLFYKVIDESGNSIWPEKYSKEKIDQIRRGYAEAGLSHVFYREYMNEAIDPSVQPFPAESHKFHEKHLVKLAGEHYLHDHNSSERIHVNVYIGVDPAISVTGDWSVIMACAMDKDRNVYVLEYRRVRENPQDLIKDIIDFATRYAPRLTTIETTAFQEVLVHYLREAMADRSMYFPIREMKPTRKKEIRLMSLEPMFKVGRVYMRQNMTELRAELQEFPFGKHDDLLDGLYNAIHDVFPAEGKSTGDTFKAEQRNARRDELNWLTL
jgi:predicted phage terminase large subunit-like protein